MDPQEIGWFVSPLQHDYDFVKGSRYVTGGGSEDLTWLRNTGNRVLTGLANTVLSSNYSDLCYGYIALRRECLEVLRAGVGRLRNRDGADCPGRPGRPAHRGGAELRARPHLRQSNLQTFRDGWRVLRTLARECTSWEAPTAGARPEALRRVKYTYPNVRCCPHVPPIRSSVLGTVAEGA